MANPPIQAFARARAQAAGRMKGKPTADDQAAQAALDNDASRNFNDQQIAENLTKKRQLQGERQRQPNPKQPYARRPGQA